MHFFISLTHIYIYKHSLHIYTSPRAARNLSRTWWNGPCSVLAWTLPVKTRYTHRVDCKKQPLLAETVIINKARKLISTNKVVIVILLTTLMAMMILMMIIMKILIKMSKSVIRMWNQMVTKCYGLVKALYYTRIIIVSVSV